MTTLLDSSDRPVLLEDGAYPVSEQADYYLEGELSPSPSRFLNEVPGSGSRLHRLNFSNYVGRAEIAGIRFDVQSSKLGANQFEEMLGRVVEDVADLAFGFNSPTGLVFERDALVANDSILFHALAYLRHVMLRAASGEKLLGQFLELARHPHRKTLTEPAWVPVERVDSVGARTVDAVVSHPERLGPLSPRSPLAATSLAMRLGSRFPMDVLSDVRTETFDTPENRLIKAVLISALDVVRAFEHRRFTNPELAQDLIQMRGELEEMRSFDFLRGVAALAALPLQSTVLQRREGYKEFLDHYLRLGLASRLSQRQEVWERLLDLKDCALLYELWCFFEVRDVLQREVGLGQPETRHVAVAVETARGVPWGAIARFRNGQVELAYNQSFPGSNASYSVALRPDLVIRARRPGRTEVLVLDAKLKFDGQRLAPYEKEDPEEWNREVTRQDLYKMHTYRDALREAVGAFVLFPGSPDARRTYRASQGSRSFEGIGALPLNPGESHSALTELLTAFVVQ